MTLTKASINMPGDYHVIPVNLIPGIMGAGVAKLFRDNFIGLDQLHAIECGKGLDIGNVRVLENVTPKRDGLFFDRPHNLVLFPTKSDWRRPSRMDWISRGLHSLAQWLVNNIPAPPADAGPSGATTVIMPALGCGRGGLEWDEVRPVIQSWSRLMLPPDIQLILCEPRGKS